MITRQSAPNVAAKRSASLNLAKLRHDAMRKTTSIQSYGVAHFRMRWLTSTYPLRTESTRMALALLFNLS